MANIAAKTPTSVANAAGAPVPVSAIMHADIQQAIAGGFGKVEGCTTYEYHPATDEFVWYFQEGVSADQMRARVQAMLDTVLKKPLDGGRWQPQYFTTTRRPVHWP